MRTQADKDRSQARHTGCKDIVAASRGGHVGAVRHFQREDPSSVMTDVGGEALRMATIKGNVEVIEVLLKAKAPVGAKSAGGQTPLHLCAMYSGDDAIAERLLVVRAPVDDVDNNGQTPLHLAVFYGRDAVAKRLLDVGAAVNAVDNDGLTPLHLAVLYGHVDIAEQLLVAGAAVDAVDNDGNTPYELAKRDPLVLGCFNPVWVITMGGNQCRCNSHRIRTVNELRDEAQKKLGIRITHFVTSDAEPWSGPIKPGITLTAICSR